ncbi:MAG: hypothetical protein SO386_03440 [Eubacteriales bacterium]|nr:hypothetical protein [Eubacteriales bacterium]
MKKALQVILHILGFPALIALVVLINLPIIKGGISYGVMVFVGVIVAAVMALIYYIAFICVVKSKKKSILKQTVTLCLVVFFTLCGFWIVVDIALPNFFADATSKTVFYEDLVDNYQARADVHVALKDEYIRRAYNAHNLPRENEEGGYTLEEYQEQGVRNANVQKLLTIQFASIDSDGYASFVDPWIGMANDDRLTIPTLIHLMTDDRTKNMENVDFALYDEALKQVKNDPVLWNVLDMMGKPMDIDMELDGTVSLVINLLSNDLAKIIGDKDILGSPIYISYNGKAITLTPSNESRGVLDYMSMAWLNNNGLLYAIVTLISVRTVFLIFAGWMILTNFMIGLLRGMGKEKVNLVKVKRGKGKEEEPARADRPANRGYDANQYRYGYVVAPNFYPQINMAEIRRQLIRDSRETRRDDYED